MTAIRAAHTPNAAARAAQPDITPLAARSAGPSLGFVGLECSSQHAQSVTNQLNLLKTYCPHASLSQAFACGRTQAATVRLNVFFLRLVCSLPDPTYFATLFTGAFWVFRDGIYNVPVPSLLHGVGEGRDEVKPGAGITMGGLARNPADEVIGTSWLRGNRELHATVALCCGLPVSSPEATTGEKNRKTEKLGHIAKIVFVFDRAMASGATLRTMRNLPLMSIRQGTLGSKSFLTSCYVYESCAMGLSLNGRVCCSAGAGSRLIAFSR